MSFYGEAEIIFPNLGIYIEKLPVGIDIFGFRLSLFGFFMVLALLMAWFVIENQVKKQKGAVEFYINMLFFSLIAAIVGAKVFYIIFSFREFLKDPWSILDFSFTHMVLYGGFVFFIGTVLIYCRKKKRSFFETADVLVVGIMVAQIIAKAGSFFSRYDIGSYTDNPLAIRVKTGPGGYNNIIYNGELYFQGHPTFLYEFIGDLILFVVLMNIKELKKQNGTLLLVYVMGYGIISIILEPMRLDTLYIGDAFIPVSVLLSIVIMCVTTIYIVVKHYKTKAN